MKVFSCRYATSVVPIGAMFAMTLWLGNTAYLYISVAFAQMLKAISKFEYTFIVCKTYFILADSNLFIF